MSNRVSIVMYHYVRDLQHSRYPGIKGLDIREFEEQLAYLEKHYTFITTEELIDAFHRGGTLPEKAVLLTFDDAYADHFETVFPLLDEKKIQGSFFPPVRAITQHRVLDVNKIHHMLACETDTARLIKQIYGLLDQYRSEYQLEENETYYRKLAVANRFDPAEIIFVKRLLQVELPEALRNQLTTRLFEEKLGLSEEQFSRELYMSPDQLRCMRRNGMHIGSHGYDHYWLASLPREKQEAEIGRSFDFIRSVGADPDALTFCYPYGSYNGDTLDLLRRQNCKLGFTTHVDVCPGSCDPLTLPRLDTNDIPKSADAPVNDWHTKG